MKLYQVFKNPGGFDRRLFLKEISTVREEPFWFGTIPAENPLEAARKYRDTRNPDCEVSVIHIGEGVFQICLRRKGGGT